MGREEFFLIVSDPHSTGAITVAPRLREAIRSNPVFIGDKGIPVTVTISMGLAYFEPAESTTCEEVIKLADDCLDRAKQSGRDRIVPHLEHCR